MRSPRHQEPPTNMTDDEDAVERSQQHDACEVVMGHIVKCNISVFGFLALGFTDLYDIVYNTIYESVALQN